MNRDTSPRNGPIKKVGNSINIHHNLPLLSRSMRNQAVSILSRCRQCSSKIFSKKSASSILENA